MFKEALKVVREKVLRHVTLDTVQTSVTVPALRGLSSEPAEKPNRGHRKTFSCVEHEDVPVSSDFVWV